MCACLCVQGSDCEGHVEVEHKTCFPLLDLHDRNTAATKQDRTGVCHDKTAHLNWCSSENNPLPCWQAADELYTQQHKTSLWVCSNVLQCAHTPKGHSSRDALVTLTTQTDTPSAYIVHTAWYIIYSASCNTQKEKVLTDVVLMAVFFSRCPSSHTMRSKVILLTTSYARTNIS